jgi:hypothetical protein
MDYLHIKHFPELWYIPKDAIPECVDFKAIKLNNNDVNLKLGGSKIKHANDRGWGITSITNNLNNNTTNLE